MALRNFCEYWMDRGQHATCCRTAEADIVASEPDVFDCDTCEFRKQVDGLDPDNADAWRRYARLTGVRWVWDMQAGPWLLDQIFAGMDDDERDDAMDRVSVIYDALHPPKEQRRHGA